MQSVLHTHKNSVYPIPIRIGQKLSDLRGLISRFVVSQALIMLAIWFVASFWIFGLIDYLPTKFGSAESPQIVRIVMLGLLVGISIYLLYRFLWQLWRVRWSDSSLALLIEKQYSEFQSSLVTTVQAASPSATANVSSSEEHPARSGLLELARERASQQIESVDVNSIVRFRPLQMQLVALGVLLALSCIVALSQPTWTAHWANRLFALSNVPWPRATELGVDGVEMDVPTFTGRNVRQRYMVKFLDGVASVPKGQSCQLRTFAKLSGKIVPDVCTVYYQDTAGNRGRANMRRLAPEAKQQSFVLDGPPLESVNESLWLSVAGGDSRISNLQLKSVDSPLVSLMQLDVTYPEYLQRSTKTTWGHESVPYRIGSRLPQGTQLDLVVQTNKPIDRCEYVIVRSGDDKEKAELPEETITVPTGTSEFRLPIGTLDSNVMVELRLWGSDGICSTRVQQYVVSTITDQPPQVDLVLQGIGTAITENAVLPVSGKVKDDYDVKQAWLETVLDENTPNRTALEVQSDGKATSQIDLKAMRDGGQLVAKVGSTLGLTLAAEDYLDLSSQPHVGRASPIQLGIVTPDQLLIILERRELAMRARLEQIIGELSQMRDLLLNIQKGNQPDGTNSASKDLPGESVDTPDSPVENNSARQLRMQILRSQQTAAQMTKSEGELRGVEKEIHQINQELINNRIDSADRRTRLEDKIRKPLLVVLDQMWQPMANDILAIEKSYSKTVQPDTSLTELMPSSIAKNNAIISALTVILNDMINIQDFNEVVDMVRGMLDDQNKVLQKTKQEQKQQLLDLLK